VGLILWCLDAWGFGNLKHIVPVALNHNQHTINTHMPQSSGHCSSCPE
jgi:hypothetical protein